MSLKGKTALITGSTSGIGLGVAIEMGKAGANVMLNGFGAPEAIEEAKAKVAATGAEVDYNGADLSDGQASFDLVTATESRFGQVDILMNNAGIQHVAQIEDFPVEKWDAVIAINLSSSFHTMRAAVPGMKERGWGRIINVASAHGHVASAGKAAYVAAKHGVIGLTKVTALECAESGVTANSICPGWVRTPLVERQIEAKAEAKGCTIEDAARDLLGEKEPTMRFTMPDEIGAMAVFLSGPAAGNITGAAFNLDGGWTAQ